MQHAGRAAEHLSAAEHFAAGQCRCSTGTTAHRRRRHPNSAALGGGLMMGKFMLQGWKNMDPEQHCPGSLSCEPFKLRLAREL